MQKRLKELGLTEKEMDLYKAGLKLGPATIQQLTVISGFKRTTVYFLIERLKKLGLTNKIFNKKKKLFEMASPEKFLKIFEEEKQKLTEKEQGIKETVSNLKAIANKAEFVADIKMFEGYEEVSEVIMELAKTKKPMYSIYSGHYFDKEDYKRIKKSVDEINRIRRRTGCESCIITDSETMIFRFYSDTRDNKLAEYRFLPADTKLPAMIDICGDKIILSSVREKTCILIQNQTIAEMMKFMFDGIWHGLRLPAEEQISKIKKVS